MIHLSICTGTPQIANICVSIVSEKNTALPTGLPPPQHLQPKCFLSKQQEQTELHCVAIMCSIRSSELAPPLSYPSARRIASQQDTPRPCHQIGSARQYVAVHGLVILSRSPVPDNLRRASAVPNPTKLTSRWHTDARRTTLEEHV